MAEKKVRLEIGRTTVGNIIFDESPPTLDIKRTPTGINLVIPAGVELWWDDREEPCPVMSNLRVIISTNEAHGHSVEVGRVWDDTVYFGVTSTEKHPDKAKLVWTNILPSIVFIEQHRNDRPPNLHFEVRGELFYMLKVFGPAPPKEHRKEPKTYDVLSIPYAFSNTVEVAYPKDVWERLIESAF